MSKAVEEQGSVGLTKVVRLRRTYLVERVQDYLLEIPAGYDIEEWLVNDLSGLDERLMDEGKLVFNDYEHVVEHDDLDLREVLIDLDEMAVVPAGHGL